MTHVPYPLLTRLLAPHALALDEAPPDAARWRSLLATLERDFGRLQLELEDSRRAYRYAADALTRATLRRLIPHLERLS